MVLFEVLARMLVGVLVRKGQVDGRFLRVVHEVSPNWWPLPVARARGRNAAWRCHDRFGASAMTAAVRLSACRAKPGFCRAKLSPDLAAARALEACPLPIVARHGSLHGDANFRIYLRRAGVMRASVSACPTRNSPPKERR